MKPGKTVRCAIYTRKSTEEGLEQDFNSLHAQREACEAYITSQRSEGWAALPKAYDDGGYSGGNIDRPALTELLADIERGLVDIVVVYKIDRLTRSLTDFAKIVERFDHKGASFVSVTQSFNTTTSMGRLTLNVLLSFAQFEREVTGERIRDKIAASKRRGMWMGGAPPVGYDPVNRKLVVNTEEAELVRSTFQRFLKVRNLKTLADQLAAEGVLSKSWQSRRGCQRGGIPYTRGALNHMLRNRLYLGEVRHKSDTFPGQHEAIIDQDLFDKVQVILTRNHVRRVDQPATRLHFPLKGIVFDDKGNKMSPVRQRQQDGTHRRYHVSQALIQGRKADAGSIARVPANGLEALMAGRLRRIVTGRSHALDRLQPDDTMNEGLDDPTKFVELVGRIDILSHSVEVMFPLEKLIPVVLPTCSGGRSHLGTEVATEIQKRLPEDDSIEMRGNQLRIRIPVRLKFWGGEKTLIEAGHSAGRQRAKVDPRLVKGLLRALHWRELLETGEVQATEQIAKREGITRAYVRAILPLAFLAPDLTQDILNGTFHPGMNIDRLVRLDLPYDWETQRRIVGQVSE